MLIFEGYIAIVILSLVSATCRAKINTTHPCDHPPSSCGSITNISYPFRLASDPPNCGDKKYGLECQSNHTVLRLFNGTYYVKNINSENETIRVVDVGIQKGNCSSFPLHSLTYDNFSHSDPYPYYYLDHYYYYDHYNIAKNSGAVVILLNCEKPAKSPLYMDPTGSCMENFISSISNKTGHWYFVVGEVRVEDVEDLCTVEMVIMITPYLLPEAEIGKSNFSFMDVHNAMAYGFELRWQEPQWKAVLWHWYDSQVLDWFFFRLAVFTGLGLGARFLLGMPFILSFLIYNFRRRHLSMFDGIESFLQSQNEFAPIRYSYSNINVMTEGFGHKLGEGGYGSVFKGKLRSGHFVAVKMLGKSKSNGLDFINEVATIGRIHHINVVRLIGYCVEGSKRALIYDFMPNGSLEKYIFSQERTFSLSCKQFFEISLGVARGIDYLHRGCDIQILHFDIKPHNILLDGNFTPKISDFGLAKLYPINNSIVSLTAARGTLGYMAPELLYKNIGGVSRKADVYSFGMLLMEMAGRRRNLNAFADHTSQIYFPSWVYDQFKEGREVEMGATTEEEKVMVKKMVMVALWCIQMNPADRPSMSKVLEMLEGNIELLTMPPKPSLCPEDAPMVEDNGKNINVAELPLLSDD